MSDKEYNIRKYPLRDAIINIIINRVNEAFSDGFHKNEEKRLMDALHSIKELIPPDKFIYWNPPPNMTFKPDEVGGDEKEVEIKIGDKYFEDRNGNFWHKCPNCNIGNIMQVFKFCPDCGSKIKWKV